MNVDPEFETPAPKPRPRRGLRLIELLSIVFGVLILIGLFLPAPRSSRASGRRMECAFNLKQVALALSGYQATYGMLPPARTVDANGRPLHSWRTLILPFLESEPLYRTIDLAKPWNDPANAEAYGVMPSVYRCPAADGPSNTTNFLAVVGPRACFAADRPRRPAEITNDRGSTLMVIEAGPGSAVHWMAPTDADELLVLGLGATTRLDHAGGTNAAFVDGSVRFLEVDVPPDELREMIAISGGRRKGRGTDDPAQGPGKAD